MGRVIPWVIVKACSVSTDPMCKGMWRRNGFTRLREINSLAKERETKSTSAPVSFKAVTFHSVRPSLANSRVTCEMRASAMSRFSLRRADET
jgi:hypothetical protein